jgi:putative methyltransferase (TIGR04325 family)
MSDFSIEKQIFPSYELALNQIGGVGYSNKTLVDVVVNKNLKFRKELNISPVLDLSAARTLFAVGLAKNGGRRLRVLDFGGGGGFHYAISKTILKSEIELVWHVVESSELCKASEALATPELKFFDSIDSALKDLESVDLIFTSSAFQYTPNPLKILKDLLKIKSRYFFITRTPMSQHNSQIVCVQRSRLADNGPGPLPPEFKDQDILYPITYTPITEIEELLNEYANIRIKIIEEKGSLTYAGAILNDSFGYFCELND